MADENPLITSVLEPASLCMRFSRCQYCGSDDYNDMSISHMIGIRYCPDHSEWAKRDCKAYLHKLNLVDVKDALNIPILKDLMQVLMSPTDVIRSNGNRDNDWKLLITHHLEETAFIKMVHGNWSVPMIKESNDLQKVVAINNLPGLNPILAKAVIEVLENGIYKDYYNLHKFQLSQSTDSCVPIDAPFIQTINGRRECVIPREHS